MLIKVGKSTWLKPVLINRLAVIFNANTDINRYSVCAYTENEQFVWSVHGAEEEAIKVMDELAEKINAN
jgi:hypothetical protein